MRKRPVRSCGDCQYFAMAPEGQMWCGANELVLRDPFEALDCEWYEPW